MMDGRIDFHRQLDIFVPSDYNEHIEIIGAGGVGSFTAVALAKLGIENIRVWDADTVEPHNLPNQFHLVKALGCSKVSSVKTLCKELAGVEIEVVNSFWDVEYASELHGIVVSAIDHIRKNDEHKTAGREELWNTLKTNVAVDLFIDARIGGETIRTLSIRPVNDVEYWSWYENQLFADGEEARLPCTARAVVDVGFFVSAIITNIIRKFLKDGVVSHEIICNVANPIQIFYPEVEVI